MRPPRPNFTVTSEGLSSTSGGLNPPPNTPTNRTLNGTRLIHWYALVHDRHCKLTVQLSIIQGGHSGLHQAPPRPTQAASFSSKSPKVPAIMCICNKKLRCLCFAIAETVLLLHIEIRILH